MPALPPRLHHAAVASTVIAGLGLLGASVSGIAATRSDLEAATRPAPPSRLVEELAPVPMRDDHRCRRTPPTHLASPEV